MRSTSLVALVLLIAAIASGVLVAVLRPETAYTIQVKNAETPDTDPPVYDNFSDGEEMAVSDIPASDRTTESPGIKRELAKRDDYEPEEEYLKDRSYHAYLAIPFFLLMAAIAVYFGNRKKKN